MIDEPLVRFGIENGVATITLNRPDSGNAINLDLAKQLLQHVISCDYDSDIRVVLIKGEGKIFCAGGDVGSFAAAGSKAPNYLNQLAGILHLSVSRIVRMRKPVVTQIHGAAAGAGFPLAMAGDIVIASENAKFTTAYTGIGLTADGASTWLLPRLLGLRKAQDLLLTGRTVTAAEADQMGLLTRIVPAADLEVAVRKSIDQLILAPTNALGRIKNLLADTYSSGLETQMEIESRYIADAASGPEAKEGIAAFLEKRKPDFIPK